VIYFFAPTPRPATKSEKQYITVLENGAISPKLPLPCWHDSHVALKEMAQKKVILPAEAFQIGEGEVFMSLVIPAYNEQDRLIGMLDEAVEYLEKQYGHHGTPSRSSSNGALQAHGFQGDPRRGWEIILVDDGSRDKTVAVALEFARRHVLRNRMAAAGQAVNSGAPAGAIRVVSLQKNRGKGGAVIHGMRHARGTYVVFADADGASKFSDLGKLVQGCERGKDKLGRAVGIGSRAHMVGTAAVVKVNFLISCCDACA
jgi:dolichyl-phosphate beta-glucosyltransferase